MISIVLIGQIARVLAAGFTRASPDIQVNVLDQTLKFLLQTHSLWMGGVVPLIHHAMAIWVHKVGQKGETATKKLQ